MYSLRNKNIPNYFGWEWATTDDNNIELAEEFNTKAWQIPWSHDEQQKVQTQNIMSETIRKMQKQKPN